MRALLIPVKEFAAAKKRLSPHFYPEARASLAEALARDFFAMVEKVRGLDRVYVVSKEPLALVWATERKWDVIIEKEQISESHSVDVALQVCADDGMTSVLRVPADIPLAEPSDIEAIFAAAESAPAMVIVPSREETGTNALLRTPPALFPSHFGLGSFARHMAEAERCGAHIKIVKNERLALDVDEIGDLRMLAPVLTRDCATRAWLDEMGF